MSTAALDFIMTAKNLASGEFAKTETSLKSLNKGFTDAQMTGTKTGDMFGALGKFGLLAGVGIATGVGAALVDFGKKAEEGEVISTRLNTALQANVAGWNGNRQAIDGYIDSQVKLGFTQDDLEASFGTIVTATHDVGKAQETLAAAEDLARLKGISLQDASSALVKVEGGHYRMLQSLGINLKANASATDALAAVQKAAAGQAAAFGGTTAGAFAEMTAEMDKTEEKIGQGLLPVFKSVADFMSEDVVPAIGGLDDALGRAGDMIERLQGQLNDLPPGIDPVAARTYDLDQKIIALSFSAEDNAAALAKLPRPIRDAGGAFEDMANSVGHADDALGEAEKPVVDLRLRFVDLGKAVDGAKAAIDKFQFGPKEAKEHLATLNDEIKKAEGHLHDLEKIKKPTLDQRIDIDQTKESLTGYQQDIVDTSLDMMKLGQKPPDAVMTWLDKLAKKNDAAGLAAWSLLNAEQSVGKVTEDIAQMFTGAKSKNPKHSAAGNFLNAGEASIVGEMGPELFIAGSSGRVIPHGQSLGAGQHLTVNINSTFPPSPAQTRELAAMIDRELHYSVSRSSPSSIRK